MLATGDILYKQLTYACLNLSVSSSSWGLGRAAVCDCGTPWTFLLPFLTCTSSDNISRTPIIN